MADGGRDDFGVLPQVGLIASVSNMKRNWLSAWIAGMVALAGVWWLWDRHLTQQVTPHGESEHASPGVPGSSTDALALNQPDTADNAAVAAESQSREPTPRLSPAVERLLREGHKAPRRSELRSLTPTEQAALVNSYRRTPSITNKLGIAWTLAYAGDAQVGELLWWSLTQEYADREFAQPSEPAQLSVLVEFLGLVAARDDLTYRRLEQGLNPVFWQTSITWTVPPRMTKPTNALSRNAIEALVLSGRPEGWQTVLNLASNPPPWFGRGHASTVQKAAYDHAMITQYGREWFWENCSGDINRMINWMASDQGRPWHD